MQLTRWFSHPARVIPTAYLAAIGAGTSRLMVPAATSANSSPALIDAAFTATSAICITGLTTVDTQTFWSP
ncbi:MAG: TrkH family potassium uptake protein, partial [Propionicimonas sp.]